MMRLNIPIIYEQEKVEGSMEVRRVKKVTFNATLFALVRNVLDIGCTGTTLYLSLLSLSPIWCHLMNFWTMWLVYRLPRMFEKM